MFVELGFGTDKVVLAFSKLIFVEVNFLTTFVWIEIRLHTDVAQRLVFELS